MSVPVLGLPRQRKIGKEEQEEEDREECVGKSHLLSELRLLAASAPGLLESEVNGFLQGIGKGPGSGDQNQFCIFKAVK